MTNEIKKKLTELTEKIKEFQKNNLVGIYLHGSLAMNCFNPESSDIDLIIVVDEKLNNEQKTEIGNFFVEFQKELSNKLETSIITSSALKDFQYPTPYELHFQDEKTGGFIPGGVDPDLAAHFVITKKRGKVLLGKPIDEVFPEIADTIYLKSIAQDFHMSYKNVSNGQNEGQCKVPTYATLNFCRVLAFIRDKLVVSKKEGGDWGLNNLPKIYQPVIKEALKEYAKSGSSSLVDAKLLKEFAEYTNKEIK